MCTIRKYLTLFKTLIALKVVTLIVLIRWKTNNITRSNLSAVRNSHDVLDAHQRLQSVSCPKRLETNKKFYMAFSYSEQLSVATDNLIALAALAVYSGRQVVVSFVNNSHFTAINLNSGTQTLALYYNLSEFNRKLRSHGYSTLVSWKRFQDVCQERLDILVHFIYGKEATSWRRKKNSTQGLVSPCWGKRKHQNFFQGFKIIRTVCVDIMILHGSVDKFHNEVVKGSPCVGIAEWTGNGTLTSFRAKFPLPLTIRRPLSKSDFVFSEPLLEVTRDFTSKSLSSDYISVHIRSEWILKRRSNGSIPTLVNCFKQLATQIKDIRSEKRRDYSGIFVAVDVLASGSKTFGVLAARTGARSLIMHLKEMLDNPVLFQPDVYNLVDGGSVAIVEMNVPSSGSELFLVGGGSFESWIRHQFAKRNKRDYAKVHYVCRD